MRKSVKKILFLFNTSLMLLSLLSCATILKGSRQPLNVTSNVDGANVSINGVVVGQTPFHGMVERKKHATLMVSKEGYSSKSMILNTEIESAFWVNILTGGPFGSTTDYASGSMWKVGPNTYNVDLMPRGK